MKLVCDIQIVVIVEFGSQTEWNSVVLRLGFNLQHYSKPKRIYLWWSLCTLYLLASQMRVTAGTQVFVVLLVLHLLRANYLPCGFIPSQHSIK